VSRESSNTVCGKLYGEILQINSPRTKVEIHARTGQCEVFRNILCVVVMHPCSFYISVHRFSI
jgi:hypothetical protein